MLLDRVRVANAGVPPPLILVDVDGLDEVPESERHGLRQLIHLFLSRGQAAVVDAVLVLTCRSPERDRARAVEGLVSSWFDTELPDVIAGQVGAVHVGDFDDDELRDAARGIADDVQRTIDEMLPGGPPTGPVSTGADPSGPGGATPIERGIIESLRHPVMWGVFSSLPASDRPLALSGNGAALATMADRFLDRFCRKAWTRRTTLRHDQGRAGLAAIGRASPRTGSSGTDRRIRVWPAMGPLNQDEAAYLYGEALIRPHPRGRPRYVAVEACLCSRPPARRRV